MKTNFLRLFIMENVQYIFSPFGNTQDTSHNYSMLFVYFSFACNAKFLFDFLFWVYTETWSGRVGVLKLKIWGGGVVLVDKHSLGTKVFTFIKKILIKKWWKQKLRTEYRNQYMWDFCLSNPLFTVNSPHLWYTLVRSGLIIMCDCLNNLLSLI